MRIWLCGDLRLEAGEERLERRLTRRQARGLLAFLVINRRQPMRREQLLAKLWPEGVEGQHAGALRVLLSDLRKALGADALSGRTQLQLTLPDDAWIDVEAAAQALAAARRATELEDWETAAAEAESAWSLTREPLLAGESAAWIEEPRRELEDAALQALELLARAERNRGRNHESEQAARLLVERAPFREAGHALLMEAIAAQGNVAEALLVYERLRELLRDELGTGPSPTLSELHGQLLTRGVETRPGAAGEPPARPALPVPLAPLAPSEGSPFVGREQELERLLKAWHDAAAGARRTVLLAGEPGIGKTSLMAQLAQRVHGGGGTVLYGRCDEDVGLPFQPFVEALRAYVNASPPDRVQRLVGRRAPELARLLPELAELIPGAVPPSRSDAALDQYLMFEAAVGLLGAIAAETPTLLVLDDLHWAPRPTLLLLRHLIRSPPDMPLAVLVAFRDTELDRAHPLAEMLADLRREPGIERFALAGLAEDDVKRLVEVQAAPDLDERRRSLARTVHEETQGNPFFVGEILRHLAESQTDEEPTEGQLDVHRLGIPESVREVVSRRLMRLSEDAMRALTVAAVAGPRFSLEVLERIPEACRDADTLLDALDEAVGARVVVESSGHGGRYAFVHSLMRQAIYSDLTAARRGRLHRRVAEALEQLYSSSIEAHLPELAHHFSQAAPGTEPRALGYIRRAGDQAEAQLAHDQAVTYYRQALELLEADVEPADATSGSEGPTSREHEACEVTIALGEAQRRAGYRSYRETLLQGARRAQRIGDRDLLARAALANNRGFFSSTGEVDDERVAILEAALETREEERSATRALLLSQLGVELIFRGDWEARIARSDEALALARTLEDPTTLALVLCHRVITLWGPDTLEERAQSANEAGSLAEALGDPQLTFYAAAYRAHAGMEAGDLAAADAALAVVHSVASELREPILQWYDLITRSKRELLGGTLEDTERLAQAGLEAGHRAGQQDAFFLFAAQLLVVRMHQGRLGELASAIGGGERRLEGSRSIPLLTHAYLATIHFQAGDETAARRSFERLMGNDLEDLPNDFAWLPVVALASMICAGLGDRERAETLLALLEPYAERFVDMGSSWLGAASHYLGLLCSALERDEQATAYFERALEAHGRLGGRVWLAHTQIELADHLQRGGGPEQAERAAALIAEALEAARELDLGAVAERAGSLQAR